MVEATKCLGDTLMSIPYNCATEFDAWELLAVGMRKIQLSHWMRKIQLSHWVLVGVVCT
jgi:hypothetical protein